MRIMRKIRCCCGVLAVLVWGACSASDDLPNDEYIGDTAPPDTHVVDTTTAPRDTADTADTAPPATESDGPATPTDTGTPTDDGTPTDIPGTDDTSAPIQKVFFDDFSYSSVAEPAFAAQGWYVRTGDGGPGVADCRWESEQVRFLSEPADEAVQLMRLVATTDGTGAGSVQAEVYTSRQFFYGTYAARVRFSDQPAEGSVAGDGLVQAFFTITPWSMANSPEYSEVDFEYLPSGGWGRATSTLWQTTWAQAEPVSNTHDAQEQSHAGWRVLVFVVTDGEVRYFVDGVQVASHGVPYAPVSIMGLHFNHWFIDGMLKPESGTRSWYQDVDWVYHVADVALTPDAVLQRVTAMRAFGLERWNSMP